MSDLGYIRENLDMLVDMLDALTFALTRETSDTWISRRDAYENGQYWVKADKTEEAE